jgi:hypothetical protein
MIDRLLCLYTGSIFTNPIACLHLAAVHLDDGWKVPLGLFDKCSRTTGLYRGSRSSLVMEKSVR